MIRCLPIAASVLMLFCLVVPLSFAQPRVTLETNLGAITLELFPDQAPVTVDNFLEYVAEGQYDSTVFHRVIPGFMIQGGGFTPNMMQLPTRAPIVNEATNRLSNTRGTIAMARTSDVNSATCQFFINLVDNTALDFKNETVQGYGYAVFGKVVGGMDVVDRIATVRTRTVGMFQNVPVDPVVVISARRIDTGASGTE